MTGIGEGARLASRGAGAPHPDMVGSILRDEAAAAGGEQERRGIVETPTPHQPFGPWLYLRTIGAWVDVRRRKPVQIPFPDVARKIGLSEEPIAGRRRR